MEYAEQLLEKYHKIWTFSGAISIVLLIGVFILFICFRIPEIIRKRRWILVLVCAFVLHFAICSELNVQAKEVAGEEEKEQEEPDKPDITAPEIFVTWKDGQGNEIDPDAYCHAKEELIMELVIQEENLDLEETRIFLEASDAAGKPLDILEAQQIHGKNWDELWRLAEEESEEEQRCWEVQEEAGVFRLWLHLRTEANYYISARIQDEAGNVPEGSMEGLVALGSLCMDRTEPVVSEEDGIIWEAGHQTFLEKLINQVTFGYFFQPSLTVKIQAFDMISGVGGITYVCEGTGGEEEPEPFVLAGTAELGKDLICEEKGMKAYMVFTIPSSFQGTIRAKAWDRSGTLMEEWMQTKGFVIESEQMHKKTSHMEVFLEGTSGGRNKFYREDVSLRFVMEDTFSGIRSIRLKAGNQEKVLAFEEEGEEIQRTMEQMLTIPASENNQNHISISGSLTDFAGHVTELTEIPVIHIDTVPPEVKVEWLNQNVRNERYYKENQTARITVKERNFDPDQIELQLTGMEAATFSWTHEAGDGCDGSPDPRSLNHRDSCTWIAELVFDRDGEYSFDFSCQDAAGNRGSYGKTDTFVIDKTPPVLLVHWDDSEALHECYYSKERRAVLEIKERNLCPEDVKSSLEGTNRGETIPVPGLGALRQWEEESWRAGITFEEDGRFQWEVHCTDMAGNEAVAYCSEEFVIDKTPPELIFENVTDLSANRGNVAPKLRATDTNFDPEQTKVSFTGSNGTGELPAYARSSEEYGFTILWGNFERIPENDDLYRIRAKAGDLAGNITEAEITFSVNRFGSVYELEEATALLTGLGGSRYTCREPELVIMEYNPDFLDYYQVTSSREGEVVELKEGRDYQVEKRGTKDTWKTYQYRIGKENFQKEGIYLVTLYSRDRAKNTSNNQVKGKTMEFIVDKTGPSVIVTGVKDKERIQGKQLEILVDIRDAYALAGAQIYLNGQSVAAYDREMLQEAEGTLIYPVSGAKFWQTLVIKAWDDAGNLTETEPIRFLVTEQVRFRFLGDDDARNVWAILSVGLLLLAGAGFLAAGKIHKKLRR